jgi:hypothetical protein
MDFWSTEAANPASSATGCFLRRVPRDAAGCLAQRTAGGSLGFRPFQGFRPLVWAGISAHLLSRACPPPQLPLATALAPQSIDRRAARPTIAGRSPLLGFCASTSLACSRLLRTRAMCSPRESPHVTMRSPLALRVRPGLPELSGPLIGVDQTPPFSSKRNLPLQK